MELRFLLTRQIYGSAGRLLLSLVTPTVGELKSHHKIDTNGCMHHASPTSLIGDEKHGALVTEARAMMHEVPRVTSQPQATQVLPVLG